VIVNGKPIDLPDGVNRVRDLRPLLSGDAPTEQIVEVKGSRTKALTDDELIEEGARLVSVPSITKGHLSRLDREIELLRQHIGRSNDVRTGKKTVGETVYHALIVKNVPVPIHKFKVARTDMLLLLPSDYPELPPIGFYVNYPWDTIDHHLTLRPYYGAPDLRSEQGGRGGGWYWYCGGLPGGTSSVEWAQHWRPGRTPEEGHSLVTLFVMAQTALTT
jgi:hypothetical protein